MGARGAVNERHRGIFNNVTWRFGSSMAIDWEWRFQRRRKSRHPAAKHGDRPARDLVDERHDEHRQHRVGYDCADVVNQRDGGFQWRRSNRHPLAEYDHRTDEPLADEWHDCDWRVRLWHGRSELAGGRSGRLQ